VPEFYHNAVFYPRSSASSPERQGLFEALRRDLARLPVARASAMVEAGRVGTTPGDEALVWTPADMATPLTAPLRAYFDSADYAGAVAESREATRFRLLPRRP
jgi:hypothetical protein